MTVATDDPSPSPGPALLLDITETAAVLRCGRTTIYELLAAGEITGVKIGRRRLVTYASVVDFVSRKAGERA